jgi:hypothetical protein
MMEGQKLCPRCTRYTDQSDVLCGHCGYNFETGEFGEAAEIPTLSEESIEEEETDLESPDLPEVPAPDRTRSGLRTVIALVVILGFSASILIVLPIRDAIDSIDRFGEADRPGEAPSKRARVRSCRASLYRYLGLLLANDGRGVGSAQSILLDAANELGAPSYEYQTLIRLYGEAGLLSLATRKGTARALERSRPLVNKECRKEYR